MRKMLTTGAVAAAIAALAGTLAFGASTAGGVTAKATVVRIGIRTIPKLGRVLVNSKGRTLYMFVPDKRSKVTCVRVCAAIWPPVKVAAGAKAVAGAGVKASLIGSDRDPSGGRVVTYNKWPLYTYVADHAAGQAKGQALNLNGGYWYVLSPSGKVIRTKLSSNG